MNKIFEELKEKMKNGETRFTFTKKNGETREAIGTVRMDMIPEEDHPKGGYAMPPNTYRYFDLEKYEWRSFIIENLVSVA